MKITSKRAAKNYVRRCVRRYMTAPIHELKFCREWRMKVIRNRLEAASEYPISNSVNRICGVSMMTMPLWEKRCICDADVSVQEIYEVIFDELLAIQIGQ